MIVLHRNEASAKSRLPLKYVPLSHSLPIALAATQSPSESTKAWIFGKRSYLHYQSAITYDYVDLLDAKHALCCCKTASQHCPAIAQQLTSLSLPSTLSATAAQLIVA